MTADGMISALLDGSAPRRSRAWLRGVQRQTPGVILLVLLALAVIGPMISVVVWAFAETWWYPSLLPNTWGLKYWADTLARADIRSALPLSVGLAAAVIEATDRLAASERELSRLTAERAEAAAQRQQFARQESSKLCARFEESESFHRACVRLRVLTLQFFEASRY